MIDVRDCLDISIDVAFPKIKEEELLPIVKYYNSDLTVYSKASDINNPKTNNPYIDREDDFLVNEEGHFLFNYNFVFVNTHKFKATGEVFEETGKYLDEEKDSIEYRQWLRDETDKRTHGLTLPCKLLKSDVNEYNSLPREKRYKLLKPLHITGEHYNFLNYGRILRTDKSSIKKGSITARKSLGLPTFFASQYYWTKAKKFAQDNGLNQVVLKSRRAGWSFQEAIDSANDANLIKNNVSIFCAYAKDYLTKGRSIAPMAKTQLDFYETNTPFNRCGVKPDGTAAGLLKKDLEDLKLGYKDSSGTATGWGSNIISVGFGPNNPDAAIGKDATKIKIEELSNAPNLSAFMNVTIPATTAGAFKTGMIIGFGTGGSTEGDWKEFKVWYLDPAKYDAMKFANVWDYNAMRKGVGFFKPYIQNLEGFDKEGNEGMDTYGNPNYVAATNIYLQERADKLANPETSQRDYLTYCGQFSNMPTESFSISKDNMFTSPEMIDHKARLESDLSLQFYRDGWISVKDGKAVFQSNAIRRTKGLTVHNYMGLSFKKGEDVYGCVREWYPPFRDSDGNIPKGLYRVYYDPVAKDKDIKTIRTDNSLDSITVKMVNTNIIPGGGDIIVAQYVGRTGSTETTNRLVLDICDYYNAQVLPEVDRGNIVSTFKRWKRRDRLIKTPIHVFDYKIKESLDSSYGIIIGGGTKKADGLDYLKEWLYTPRGVSDDGATLYNFHFIYDIHTIEELLTWNPEDNFDRVSTLIIMVYDVQEMLITKHKVEQRSKTKGKSIFNRSWYQ